MRNRLVYLLKHNTVLLTIYKIVMSFLFRIWGFFIKTDDSLVLFVSFMGKGFNDSPKVIYDYIDSHPEYSELRCVWAFEDPGKYPELDTVKIDSRRYFKTALKAKYWITNTNIERGLKFKKKGQKYLNTWHGTALKLIGNDCPGRNDYNFDTVDYLCVSGEYDEQVFKSAFNAPEKCFLRCGLPRNEELWDANETKKEEIRKKINLPLNRKIVLYAPTWRDSTDGGKSYEINPPIHFDRWKSELGDDFLILFRAHHQTTKVMGIQFDEFIRDVSDYPAVNDLMIASDILITDYSAIAFDYSILCRPMFCYGYDYDTYIKERGTYFNMDEKYPNPVIRSEDKLIHSIKNIIYSVEHDKAQKFRNEFIRYGNASTEICLKALFGGDKL